MIHEDERRILESFPEAKIIKVKQDCVIGEHYHKIKTEKFVLCEGYCTISGIDNNGITFSEDMKIGYFYTIEPLKYHVFNIKKDSVLLGFNSHPYDPTDDYKL